MSTLDQFIIERIGSDTASCHYTDLRYEIKNPQLPERPYVEECYFERILKVLDRKELSNESKAIEISRIACEIAEEQAIKFLDMLRG
jgi:hypothetical protein